ncbi:MAG: acetate--CoA ligase family protein [Desulfobacterales bacterium]
MPDPPDLSKLLDPKAIAVIGASPIPGKVGRIIFEGLIPSLRKLYPVHPDVPAVLGYPAVRSVSELPPGVDLAVIATNARSAVTSAEQCAEHGIPFIIVVAGGFGETSAEGRALEARLKSIPELHGSRILGPNSLGLFIPAERLDTLFVEHGDKALSRGGGIAFISQSGSVGVEALGLASNTGFGMRAFVGLGNKCDLDELDFLHHFASDPNTRCLAFYLESIEHGRAFLRAAGSVTRRKPVVVLKSGRTRAGADAVAGHTGRLAGSDQVVGGAFRQYGIQRVMDDEELCDASKCLSMLPPAPGNRVAVVTPAGGYGVMCADYVESPARGVRLAMARLRPETANRIREATFPYAAVGNPVDLTASATDDMFGRSLDLLIEDDGVDIVICTALFSPPSISDRLIGEIASRAAGSRKPVIVFTQYGPFTDLYLRRLHDAGVVGFPSIARAVRAARFLVDRARILEDLEEMEDEAAN